jgi:soluble lytic murein transglycosylase-like protein
VRYATQARDASYSLAYSEAPAPLPLVTHVPEVRPAIGVSPLRVIIRRVAERHGVSPALVEAIVAVESGMNPQAVSAKGAQGAMQLMPATAARYGLSSSAALRHPEQNIDAGVRHLKDLLTRYQGNVALALAAYNAGAGAVTRHHGRIPPYRETMLYVPAVLARAATSP